MGLIPELRADKNGKMVTRHVRTGVSFASRSSLPAPQLASKKLTEPKPSTKQKRHEMVDVRYANEDLKKANKKRSFIVGMTHFECSDEEAYSVLTVAGFDNTLALLDAGVRSKHEALDFLSENNLEYLIEDNSELVQEAIARKMPAIPAIEGFKTANASRPTYYDAAEAYSIKALRDPTSAGYDFQHLVAMGKVSLSDLKHIGVTRVAKAERTMMTGITKELEAIHAGTSEYDIDTLKKLIILEEESYSNSLNDTVRMANYYGAEFILGLRYYSRAVNHHDTMRKSERSTEDKAQIIKIADDMLVQNVNVSFADVMDAHDAGVTADKLVEGLGNDLSVKEIIAINSGIESSLTSGWL